MTRSLSPPALAAQQWAAGVLVNDMQLPVVKVDCGTCHACCIEGHAVLGPLDDPSRYVTERVHGELAIAKAPNGDCVYLHRGVGCTIYDDRPDVCRQNDCVAMHRARVAMMPMTAKAGRERAAWV